jgi:hypothetical protein
VQKIIIYIFTGLILKIKLLTHVREKEVYCDADFFEVPEDYDFTSRVTSHIDHVELTETKVRIWKNTHENFL